tara:strand:- start:27 stop:425 length:399 start_codon:yes stop_codon:yes gene_type:complete
MSRFFFLTLNLGVVDISSLGKVSKTEAKKRTQQFNEQLGNGYLPHDQYEWINDGDYDCRAIFNGFVSENRPLFLLVDDNGKVFGKKSCYNNQKNDEWGRLGISTDDLSPDTVYNIRIETRNGGQAKIKALTT